MKNQLKKVAIGVDTTCVASDNSGSETNAQGVVAIPSNLCLIPTILCGGAGSRLWPVSRELHPKPFIRLADGQSLLQKAYLRGAQLPGVRHLMTVTNRELFFKTEDEFREVNATNASTSFILEPFGRNTAPAIAAAALQVAKTHGSDAILLVLAADHLILDQAAFQSAVAKAVELAQQGKLVTFGIQPDAPETGYGYIESDGNSVLRFVEKPSLEKAKEYLASGRFLWNSGIFCFAAGTMLEQMEKHCPTILSATRECMEQSRLATGNGFSQLELDAAAFKSVPDDSIDYAVMEKSDQVAVVPCNIGWSDIGSWSALGDLDAADANGNRIQGETMLHNTRNCTIQSNDRLVGAVGVENLIIIDTPDAVLVANKANAQDVKHIYAELKAKGHEAHKLHRTVHRPWGTYTVLEEGDGFKIKRIEVKPGASLSLQMHQHRSEHWVVVNGSAKVINGEREIVINTNESTFIPAGHKHRLTNPGTATCVMIEVQSGEYVVEDDIVRFEDAYGRVTGGAELFPSVWRHRSLFVELTKREFSGKYRGSFGGIVWSFAQPLFLLTVYTIAFGVILKARWGFSGSTREYALMLFAGLIVFNAFSEVLTKSTTLITANPNFVKKVVFPLELLPVITVTTALIHALIGVGVWLAGYILLMGVPKATIFVFPLVLICFVPVLLGLGWLLSSVGVVVKDISQLTGMLNHTLLFLTPIFYSIEAAPPLLQNLLMLNPLTFIVEQFRLVLFYGQMPALKGLAVYFALSSAFAWASYVLFKRLRPSFADMV